MHTAFYYTKKVNDTCDTVKYLANKYCINLIVIEDLRQMILKGCDMLKYMLFVDTTSVSISDDLLEYMLLQGGNAKLTGVILICDKTNNNKIECNNMYKVYLDENFKTNFVDRAFRLIDSSKEKVSLADVGQEINKLLEVAKVMPKYIGFGYIKDAVSFCLADNGNVDKLSNTVYPYIASKNNTTVNNVERNIRIALESAWKTENNAFGFYKKPSNKAFIAYIVNDIKKSIN